MESYSVHCSVYVHIESNTMYLLDVCELFVVNVFHVNM